MPTFGQQLRLHRRQCTDPLRGGLLTQERLGELIGQEMGDAGYSGAAVSDWERDKSKIHADDRRVLVALLAAIVKCGGIDNLEDADKLLALGNYRGLDASEVQHAFGATLPLGLTDQVDASASRGQAPRTARDVRPRAERVLLEKVRQFWVDGVFAKATADAPELTLTLCSVDEAVDHPWQSSLGPALIGDRCRAGDVVIDVFKRADRALLILGSPGSGKTMTLIQLADSLLQVAEQDHRAPLPVILDLAGWAKERRDLGEWIVEELAAKYQIPRHYTRDWLAADRLNLLLDGFDVLPIPARLPCIRVINDFRETNGLSGLAVCSRSQEYLACQTKLRLNHAIRVEPLDGDQIADFVRRHGDPVLSRAIRENETVRQLAHSPLLLHVLAAVSSESAESGQSALAATMGDIEDESAYDPLFEAYLQQAFGRRPPSKIYSRRQTRHYLQWLARHMEAHSQSIFMIEAMQPSWLPSKGWRWAYMLLSGSLLGLAGGTIMWLLWRLLRHTLPQLPAAVSSRLADWMHVTSEPLELLTIMTGNFALGLLVALTIGFYFERRRSRPIDANRIRQERWLQVWSAGLVSGASAFIFILPFAGPLLALAWGIAEGFMYMAAARFLFGWSYASDIRTVEALGWSWPRSLTGTAVGVVLTVIAEVLESALYGYNGFMRTLLTLAVAGFILGGITGSRTTAKSWPNQGVWLSLRNAGLAAVIVTVPLTLLALIIRDLQYALVLAMLLTLVAVSLFGAGVFVKHFLLRALLRIRGGLPWRYTRFLDYAAQLVMLRKVGGGYIFMHRLLQQYLARTRSES